MRKQLERRRRPPFPNGYTVREAARLLDLPVGRVYTYVRAGSSIRGAARAASTASPSRIWCSCVRERAGRAGLAAPCEARARQFAPAAAARARAHRLAHPLGWRARRGSRWRTTWMPESGQTLFDFHVAELTPGVEPLVRRAAQARRAAPRRSGRGLVRAGLRAGDGGSGASTRRLCTRSRPRRHARRCARQPGAAPARIRRPPRRRGPLPHGARGRGGGCDRGLQLGRPAAGRRAAAGGGAGLSKAIRADPQHADAHFNLAHLFEELGRKQGAVRHLQIYRRLAAGAP